jgi:hypothetical protein
MKFRVFLVAFLPGVLFATANAQLSGPELLKKSMVAMGGEQLLASLQTISYTAKGHEAMIEQSERQEAPYQLSYFSLQVEKNLAKSKCLYSIWYSGNPRPYRLLVDKNRVGAIVGKNYFPMYPETDEQIDLSPEKILTKAFSSEPSYRGDSVIQGMKNHIVSFKWNDMPVRLFLNDQTALLTAVEVTRYYTSNFNYVWGDTKRFTLYSFWHLENNGLHYPYQSDTYVNKMPFRSLTIDSIRYNLQSLAVDTLVFPDSSYQKMQVMQRAIDPLQEPSLKSIEISSGIFQVPGNWNTWFVRTKDGIVIIESPVSSVYSSSVIEFIQKQFPTERIKAVISTSNAWPHVGGIRTYVARKIPIYGLELNKDLIIQLISSVHSFHPDELSEKHVPAKLNWVNKRLDIGVGENRMQLIPMLTETGERMMMVYFPERKLLYTSDMVQPSFKGGFFMKQYLSEVRDVIDREKLVVENIFGMHLPLTPYDKLLEALR